MTTSEQKPADEPADEAWLDELAGRHTGQGDAQTQALRQTLLAQAPEVDEEHLAQQKQRLLFRLRKEESARLKAQKTKRLSLALAAGVVLLLGGNAVLTLLKQPPVEPEIQYRGQNADGYQVLSLANPRQFAEKLKQMIDAAGGQALVYQTDGEWRLQGTLPAELSPELADELASLKLPVTPGGPIKLMLRKEP